MLGQYFSLHIIENLGNKLQSNKTRHWNHIPVGSGSHRHSGTNRKTSKISSWERRHRHPLQTVKIWGEISLKNGSSTGTSSPRRSWVTRKMAVMHNLRFRLPLINRRRRKIGTLLVIGCYISMTFWQMRVSWLARRSLTPASFHLPAYNI